MKTSKQEGLRLERPLPGLFRLSRMTERRRRVLLTPSPATCAPPAVWASNLHLITSMFSYSLDTLAW